MVGDIVQSMTIVQFFLLCLGWPIIYLVLKCTNKNLSDDKQLDRGEFLRFVGLWLLMSSIDGGFDKMEYWSTVPAGDMLSGAPYRFNTWMSRNRFRAILHALLYSDEEKPRYADKFHCVRKLIRLWNENIQEIFRPGWLTCLDESMSRWFTKISCPGWVFCPRQPHSFGNEYHSICCSLSGIMFGIELVEGKDRPKQIPTQCTHKDGPTVGLLLRLTKLIHGTGKVVILDSGFCVLKGIVLLMKLGVCASA